jgi:hypothetical protein
MEVGKIMFEDVFETVIKGSNTVYLNIPDDKYFVNYDEINNTAAEEIANNYFYSRGRNVIPFVEDIDYDASIHNIKINVKVQQQDKMEKALRQ